MKEHGILYSAPMVLAHLADRKTQTRRTDGLKVINEDPHNWTIEQQGLISAPGHKHSGKYGVLFKRSDGFFRCVPFPYVARDRLWIREAWRTCAKYDSMDSPAMQLKIAIANAYDKIPVHYEADGAQRNWPGEGIDAGRYRHARFMPRWASRIDREVTAIRCERLQDISEPDCWAEGIEAVDGMFDEQIYEMARRLTIPFEDAKPTYACLWESINGAGSWDADLYVWVITFRKIEL
jgi:hypothetical protein